MEAAVVLDEEEEVMDVPVMTEDNADVPPTVHHQQIVEELGWGGCYGLHCHLKMKTIL